MRFFILLCAVCVFGMPALAQSQYDMHGRKIAEETPPVPLSLADVLLAVNKNSVLNGGGYVSSKNLLKRGVRDSAGKQIGEVRDVYVASGGTVPAVTAVFNRLRLNGTVALDVTADKVVGDKAGYVTGGLSAEQIQGGFPQLVERTKTASPTQNGFSVSKLIGADVMSRGGEEVGKVKEILFDVKGERADLAFVTLSYGPVKNKSVVVPFSTFTLEDKRGRGQLVAPVTDIETILKFAMGQK